MGQDTFDSAWRRGYVARLKGIADARIPDELAIMPLGETLAALGKESESDLGEQDVPVDAVVGTVARAGDFDRHFRPLTRTLRQRWETLARTSADLPPVRLVQLGELYFVEDGHHRVSIARARGAARIPAQVHYICTVACAHRCLTVADLPSKTAERLFLERVPLDNDVRLGLWLDDPRDWFRLADSAEAWGPKMCTVGGRWAAGSWTVGSSWPRRGGVKRWFRCWKGFGPEVSALHLAISRPISAMV